MTTQKKKISELEDRAVEITPSKEQRGKRMRRKEESLWDTIKRNNVCIIGVPEGEMRKIR